MPDGVPPLWSWPVGGGGLLGRESTLADVGVDHLAGQVLRLLHVGLIERVDPEDRTGDGDGELPGEEEGAEVDGVLEWNLDHRMAGVGELGQAAIGVAVRRRAVSQMREDTILAVDGRLAERLARDRDDPRAVLAGALGHELLGPEAEARQGLVDDEGELVATAPRELADREAQPQRAAARAGKRGHGGVDGDLRSLEHLSRVDAGGGGGDHSEVRERRVAPTDLGVGAKYVAEALAPSEVLERRSRIGDRHEAVRVRDLAAEVAVEAGRLQGGP